LKSLSHDDILNANGRAADYAVLARFHYRPTRPATVVHTLSAIDATSGELIGVLTISMPTLNGPWRTRVWPHLFAGRDKRQSAAIVNANLRTISRVIVDPRYRALGVARRLVEAYLSAPLTRCTEAIAAMGRYCPFFAHAGMQELTPLPSRRNSRLRRVLEAHAIRPWELVDLRRAASEVRRSRPLRQALRAWANDSRATRRLMGCETTLAAAAGATLAARPRIYVATTPRSAPTAEDHATTSTVRLT
jgi:hypothetical protein